VRGDIGVVGFRHAGNEAHFRDASGVAEIGLEDRGGFLFEHFAKTPFSRDSDLSVEYQLEVAHILWFPYYGSVNITLSLNEDLVKKVRKIAVDRDMTLTGLVRDYLESLAAEDAASGRKRREREALERSFERFQFKVGKRTWTREDLHARS
jgi:hypothetical protein